MALDEGCLDLLRVLKGEGLAGQWPFSKSPVEGLDSSIPVDYNNVLSGLVELLLVELSIGNILEVAHLLLEVEEEVLELWQLEIFVDGVVDQFLTGPVDA